MWTTRATTSAVRHGASGMFSSAVGHEAPPRPRRMPWAHMKCGREGCKFECHWKVTQATYWTLIKNVIYMCTYFIDNVYSKKHNCFFLPMLINCWFYYIL